MVIFFPVETAETLVGGGFGGYFVCCCEIACYDRSSPSDHRKSCFYSLKISAIELFRSIRSHMLFSQQLLTIEMYPFSRPNLISGIGFHT